MTTGNTAKMKAEGLKDVTPGPPPSEHTGLVERLRDPVAVHINMLHGAIAKPSVEQILHLYPELALRSEVERLTRELHMGFHEKHAVLFRRAEDAEARLQQMTKALEEIAETDILYPPHDPGSYMPPKGRDGPCRKIALKALRAALSTQGSDT